MSLRPSGLLLGRHARLLCMASAAEVSLSCLIPFRIRQANTVLNDLTAFDAITYIWARLLLCGVPPSPRECCACTVMGPTLFVFGGRGRTCHADCAIFHLSRETRSGALANPEVIASPCVIQFS